MNGQIIKVTSKGQIAIPVGIRKELSIESGDSLIAYVYGDTLMLKVLKIPSEEDFRKTMDAAQEWARAKGLNEADVNDFIKAARKERDV